MRYFTRLYNRFKNHYKYRSHTAKVMNFIKKNYCGLKLDFCRGPIFDDEEYRDREELKDLLYLVKFDKKCPENQVFLKVNKVTQEISEVEKY